MMKVYTILLYRADLKIESIDVVGRDIWEAIDSIREICMKEGSEPLSVSLRAVEN